MTRRERIEARADRREEWADKASDKAAGAFRRAERAVDGIPPGQPILVGHHSERHHRAALDRHDSAMRQGCERADMAAHHRGKAAGLRRQLATSIYSDDPDATERLAAKAAAITSGADWMAGVNKAWRKAGKPDLRRPVTEWGEFPRLAGLDDAGVARVQQAMRHRWEDQPQPFPAYALTNARANARRQAKRIEDVERAKAATEAAEQAGGVLVHVTGDRCSIRFAEKPARDVLEGLRAGLFFWSGGAWHGALAQVPSSVVALCRCGQPDCHVPASRIGDTGPTCGNHQ